MTHKTWTCEEFWKKWLKVIKYMFKFKLNSITLNYSLSPYQLWLTREVPWGHWFCPWCLSSNHQTAPGAIVSAHPAAPGRLFGTWRTLTSLPIMSQLFWWFPLSEIPKIHCEHLTWFLWTISRQLELEIKIKLIFLFKIQRLLDSLILEYLSLQLPDKHNGIDNLWEIFPLWYSFVASSLSSSFLEIIFSFSQIHI